MNKNELISKLEELDALIRKSQELEYDIKYGCFEEFDNKKESIKGSLGKLKGIPEAFSNMPVFPISDEKLKQSKAKHDKVLKILIISAIVLVSSFLFGKIATWLSLFNIGYYLGMIKTVSIISTVCLAGYLLFSVNNDYYGNKKEYEASIKKFEKTSSDFERSVAVYKDQVESGTAAAKEYKDQYVAAYNEVQKEWEKTAANIIEAEAKRDETIKNINANEIISYEYLDYVPEVLSLLKSSRADDLKEALNLAVRERKEEQERATRMREEANRTAIMREQAEEQRRHNEQVAKLQKESIEVQKQQLRMEEDRIKAEKDARNKKEYLPGLGLYRDGTGTYYKHSWGGAVPAPVSVEDSKKH